MCLPREEKELVSSGVRMLAAGAHPVTSGVQLWQGSEVSKVTVMVWAAVDDPVAGRSREHSPSLFGGLSHAFMCPAMREKTGWATCLRGPQRMERRKNKDVKKVLSLSSHLHHITILKGGQLELESQQGTLLFACALPGSSLLGQRHVT